MNILFKYIPFVIKWNKNITTTNIIVLYSILRKIIVLTIHKYKYTQEQNEYYEIIYLNNIVQNEMPINNN